MIQVYYVSIALVLQSSRKGLSFCRVCVNVPLKQYTCVKIVYEHFRADTDVNHINFKSS